jgi:UDP-N-acetylglucosamine 1-carboxyvinyltransferase
MSDRNEEVTFAVASAITHGNIVVKSSVRQHLSPFLELFQQSGGIVESLDATTTRYSVEAIIKPSDIVTHPHPGFMTDWQGPWAVLMTQALGVSTIHETVFERRFSYVKHLNNMGADIVYFDPIVSDPENFYNFHWHHKIEGFHQGIRIIGPTHLHNAVVEMDDIRAGATLVLAALSAAGQSYLYQAEILDRGYESIEKRLLDLGAAIDRIKEDQV